MLVLSPVYSVLIVPVAAATAAATHRDYTLKCHITVTLKHLRQKTCERV